MSTGHSTRKKRLTTTIFTVKGESATLEDRLSAIKGISRARMNTVTSTMWVEYNPRVVSEAKIKEVCSRPV